MTDEAAMLLRVSVFGFAAGIIYWFLSYEPLGTVALLLLGAGPGFAGLVLLQEQRARGGTGESRADAMRRLAGIPPQDPPDLRKVGRLVVHGAQHPEAPSHVDGSRRDR